MSRFDASHDIVEETDAVLKARTSRAPDHAAENRAMLRLATGMAERPESVLDILCEALMDTCGAASAGVSLLEADGEDAGFFWPAIKGTCAPRYLLFTL